jgi:hypothetical protein
MRVELRNFGRYDFPAADHVVDRGTAHLGDFRHLVDSKKLDGHVSALLLGFGGAKLAVSLRQFIKLAFHLQVERAPLAPQALRSSACLIRIRQSPIVGVRMRLGPLVVVAVCLRLPHATHPLR